MLRLSTAMHISVVCVSKLDMHWAHVLSVRRALAYLHHTIIIHSDNLMINRLSRFEQIGHEESRDVSLEGTRPGDTFGAVLDR